MNKFKEKIIKFLLYGGLSSETYASIRGRISDENRRSTNIFTLLGALAFLLTGLSTSLTNRGAPVAVYYSGVGVFLLMFILNYTLGKKYNIICDFFAVTFSILILGLGIYIAYGQCEERTTMLLPLFGLVSLVFCYRPIYLVAILTIAEAVYLVVMKPPVQTYEIYFVDLVNTLIFCIIGLIGGLYTLSFKHQKHKADFEKQTLLEKDTLTGLFNRYSWMKAFENIEKNKTSVTICSIDVNGLKKINDTKGHAAGDELIIGAATCVHDVFRDYGDTYRIGGDEFSVIIYKEHDMEKLRKKLDARTRYWEGKKCNELSVSLGVAKLDFDQNCTVEEAIHNADVEMYKEKRSFYDRQK